MCAVNMCFSVSPCQVLLVFMKYDHTPGVSAHLTFKENVAYVNIKYDKSKIKMKKTNSGLAFRFSRTTKVWILCYKKCHSHWQVELLTSPAVEIMQGSY